MKSFLEGLVNLIFPAQCHICGVDLSPHERFICTGCVESLPRTGYHRNALNPMGERFAGQFPFKKATGHFFYSRDSSLAQLVQDMKYRGFPTLGIKLGELAGRELYISGFFSDIDMIIPVPMYFIKKARRRYNQAEKIAEGLSRATGLPLVDELKMLRSRKSQTALSRTQRLENARSLFEARHKTNLNGKGVLLVDDICTTGATIGAAAKALYDAYPDMSLSLFTLGVTF